MIPAGESRLQESSWCSTPTRGNPRLAGVGRDELKRMGARLPRPDFSLEFIRLVGLNKLFGEDLALLEVVFVREHVLHGAAQGVGHLLDSLFADLIKRELKEVDLHRLAGIDLILNAI